MTQSKSSVVIPLAGQVVHNNSDLDCYMISMAKTLNPSPSYLLSITLIHRGVSASTNTGRFHQPLMAKLKGQAFQTRLDEYSPFIRHEFGCMDRKSSQIRIVKNRMPCKVSTGSLTGSVVGPYISSSLCGNAILGSKTGNIPQFSSRFWFMDPDICVNTWRYMPSGGATYSAYHFGAIFKRAFSKNAKSRAQKDVKNISNNEQSGAFSSVEKRAKSVSFYRGLVPQFSLNSNSKVLSEVFADGGKKDIQPGTANIDSSTGLKKKRQSRSKKKKDELSSTSDDAGKLKTLETGPTAKADSCIKISQNNSTGNTLGKVNDPSDSEKLPKKKTKASRKKGKSLKEADVAVAFNGISLSNLKQESSIFDSAQTAATQTTGKIKQAGKIWDPLYPPRGKSVVVVESLTKAKVIQGYLGDMYEVLPSYGHIRDLAARSGSVRPDDDFSMVWEVPSPAWTHLKSIKVAMSGADNLILASDPDREGEAIAWHIFEMLKQQDALCKDVNVARVVFQEITQSAIKAALQSPRDIDENLVQAYLARRALDYLIGFNISPLLWRKLPGCQSAGRVQSAALSLICDREMEILQFKAHEYWTVNALFKPSKTDNYFLHSHLTHFDSKKLNQLSVGSESEAKNIGQAISTSSFKVVGAKRSKVNKNPPTPYITSTLQQDAANKLNFSAAYTMKLAQKLYEEGLITYMRTDGLHISNEVVQDIRSMVADRYGHMHVSANPRKYFKKVKNAQEAHEAIRPTDITRLSSMLSGKVDEDCLKLYTLIWSRTMACQMEPAKVALIQIDVGNSNQSIVFRAACSVVEFLGYKAVYEDKETRVIKNDENETKDLGQSFLALGDLKLGDPLDLGKVELKEHHTQPLPRYSEASLVKKLEELGIGRPSTYAAILKVLQDRKYVTIKSRVIYPEFRGRMVSAFLSHYFSEVTDYSFTADMETELDNVSAGMTEWKGLLKDYWTRFSTYCDRTGKVHIHQVEKMLEKTFGDSLFSFIPGASRTCPSCLEGTLVFKVSRYGAGYFIGCDQHPSCKHIAKTLYGEEEDDDTPETRKSMEEPKVIGVHPVSGEKVLLKNGPYGSYVQLGEDRKGYTPKRSSVSQVSSLLMLPEPGVFQIKDIKSITIDEAVELLRYPITLDMKPIDITMEAAMELLISGEITQTGRPKRAKPQGQSLEAL
ncbi:hypothetical protein V2J09_020996 [Rumex salicifolius]